MVCPRRTDVERHRSVLLANPSIRFFLRLIISHSSVNRRPAPHARVSRSLSLSIRSTTAAAMSVPVAENRFSPSFLSPPFSTRSSWRPSRALAAFPYLTWAFRRSPAAAWSPGGPWTRWARMARSGWRSNTTFAVGSLSWTWCPRTVPGNSRTLSRSSGRAYLRTNRRATAVRR